jgi:hypothetical protein
MGRPLHLTAKVAVTGVVMRLTHVLNKYVWLTVILAVLVVVSIVTMLMETTTIFGGTSLHKASEANSVSGPGSQDGHCFKGTTRSLSEVTDNYDRQVLALGPSLYLALGSLSSGVESDLSSHGRNGLYISDAGQPELTRLPNGDMATVFNGLNQYVQVPSTKALSITATGCLTIEAWIRPAVLSFPRTQGSGYVHILGKGTAGKQEYALRMYSFHNSETPPRPNRVSAYAFNLSGGKGSGAYFQDKIDPGAWIMVTFVVDSRSSAAWPDGYIAIYKDGQMRAQPVSLSQFNVVPKAADAPFRIATRDLESFFEGAIGKVAVYDYILSPQDILATYRAMID